ncbi:MAG: hypothetical protein ACOZF2_17750 [Thermodesulfobacteriota bacterium]
MLKKVILLMVLLCLGVAFSAVAGDKGLTFTGKIEEIAMKTVLTPLGGSEKILTLKLDSKPKLDFRMPAKDAARYGLIDTPKPSAILLPGQVKGVGWKVKLTCDKESSFGGEPAYQVTKLEKLD